MVKTQQLNTPMIIQSFDVKMNVFFLNYFNQKNDEEPFDIEVQ